MPIEIRELHIKAVIEQSNDENEDSTSSQNSDDLANYARNQNIINQAVENVLKILNEKNER